MAPVGGRLGVDSQHTTEFLIYRAVLTKECLIILLLKMGLTCQEVINMAAAEESYTVVLHRNSLASEGSVPVSLIERANEEVEVTLNLCFYEGRHNTYTHTWVCMYVCECLCVYVRVSCDFLMCELVLRTYHLREHSDPGLIFLGGFHLVKQHRHSTLKGPTALI